MRYRDLAFLRNWSIEIICNGHSEGPVIELKHSAVATGIEVKDYNVH